jgi:DNA invertase Pin-like site-specific DNA recombinase
MTTVGYARVSSTGQDLSVQLEKLQVSGCEKIFQEKRSGVDAGRPELKRCLGYLREGDTLLVTKRSPRTLNLRPLPHHQPAR